MSNENKVEMGAPNRIGRITYQVKNLSPVFLSLVVAAEAEGLETGFDATNKSAGMGLFDANFAEGTVGHVVQKTTSPSLAGLVLAGLLSACELSRDAAAALNMFTVLGRDSFTVADLHPQFVGFLAQRGFLYATEFSEQFLQRELAEGRWDAAAQTRRGVVRRLLGNQDYAATMIIARAGQVTRG